MGVNGQTTYWVSEQTFSFDNEYPRVDSVYCEFPGAATVSHDLSVTVEASQMFKIACIYMYVMDSDGKYIIEKQEVYNRSAISAGKLQFTDNVGVITLTADDLGLADGDYKWVSAGFVALDSKVNF